MHSTSRPATVAGAVARAVVVVLLAVAGLAGVGTGLAAGADAVPWTVRTAANEFGSDRNNYSYTVDPGGRIEDGLVVANHGTTSLDLAVYSADAFTTDAGQLDLVTEDATSTGVGAWVDPGQDHLTIQPGQSAEVPFAVTVPENATAGDHMGGIVTSLTQGGVERRVGIRIQLRVGGGLKPGLSVEGLGVHYSGTPNPFGKGDATTTYTIRNTGNVILSARQAVSLSGPFGSWPVPSGQIDDSPRLLPGETWQVSVPFRGVVSALQLTGTVTLVPLLTDAAGSTAPLPAVENTTHAWAIPWGLFLLIAVMCVLVVAVLAFRRRQAKISPE
ncbi:WxL protein peptidoglycan domain-containing protein [Saccharopolyspora sp. ASAGF58]|uniref:WxL protein peptidoglycan domain-containing protein n=1 Tax=Saccharopolyspora sp. ASAGF58 TaxID=2719023 RepID=UPI00143FCCE3|nr:DUF916 domain-containing protein [Saccharopolyspora sp. ASAGF58]QIZ37413.1 DUF916 domain-containing protein [Saccharopolyspora sp. ASAGF58]